MKIKIPRNLVVKRPGAYLVGGSVRDMIRGQSPRDYDIAVASAPEQYAAQMAHRTHGRVILMGKRGFTVHRVVTHRECYDIMPFKGPNIHQDLRARDFTINALACDLSDGAIIDITDGLKDLQTGVVRMISPAVFEQDPARLVRAFRMAATLEFHIDSQTLKAITTHAALLDKTAAERIWNELLQILSCHNCHPILGMMVDTNVLATIFPELSPLKTCRQNHYHHQDALAHSLRAIELLEEIFSGLHAGAAPTATSFAKDLDPLTGALLKLALLLHDIGKPACRTIDPGGRIHFYGHAARGAEDMQAIARRLRISNRQKTWVTSLIRRHQRPLSLYLACQDNQKPQARAVGRFFHQCGENTPLVLVMAMADNLSKSRSPEDRHPPLIPFLDKLLATFLNKNQGGKLPPLLNGKELLAHFNLQPSPLIGALLRRVAERHLGGAISTRREALEWVATYLRAHEKKKPPAVKAGRGLRSR